MTSSIFSVEGSARVFKFAISELSVSRKMNLQENMRWFQFGSEVPECKVHNISKSLLEFTLSNKNCGFHDSRQA